MAGRVNVKFVLILSIGLALVCAGVVSAYLVFVRKSGDDFVRAAEEAAAAGDYGRAQTLYGHAVSRDRTNVEWLTGWREVMERWTPETQTAYQDAFLTRYTPLIQTLASVQRTSVEANHDYLGMLYERLIFGGYSRSLCDMIIRETERAISHFEMVTDADPRWQTLRRYRGLAAVTILSEGDALDDDVRRKAQEDLTAALEADPPDVESAVALMRWHDVRAREARRVGNQAEARRATDSAVGVVERFVEQNPSNAKALVNRFAIQADRERRRAREGLVGSAADRAVIEATRRLAEDLDDLAEAVRSWDGGDLDLRTISRFMAIERLLDPRSRLERSDRLLRSRVERDASSNAQLLLMAATTAGERGEYERAVAMLHRVQRLERPPLSLAGLIQHDLQTRTYYLESDMELRAHQAVGTEPGQSEAREAAMRRAVAARDEFAQRVAEGADQLVYLDGMIAFTKGEMREASRLFRRYNDQRTTRDPEGLWREAQAAARLNEFGRAKTRLEEILAIDETNASAMLLLAEVETQLRNRTRAIELLRTVQSRDPSNTAVADRLRTLQEIEGEIRSEDPVRQALLEARRLREGTGASPPDVIAAREYLERLIGELNYQPAVARELAGIRLDAGDFAGARQVIEVSAERHPDDAAIRDLREAIAAAQSPVEAIVAVIDRTDADQISKLLSKYSVYRNGGEAEAADRVLDEAAEVEPDHPAVLELRFVRALERGDMDSAARMVERAVAVNADRVQGETFEARLRAAGGDLDGALRSLERAIATGSADASVYRLLGAQQAAAGRIEEAIGSFERGLALRPDDTQTVVGYLRVLVGSGRLEDALREARRLERYGRGSRDFVDLWLGLEAQLGGEAGRRLAIERRERRAEREPSDRGNRAALANLYMDARSWERARRLLDELRAEEDGLGLVELDARWHADQGRVSTPDGPRDGLEMARSLYARYIARAGEGAGAAPYLSLARFMIQRGRYDVAVRAIEEGQQRQDPDRRDADKLLGDLMFSLERFDNAAEVFGSVVDADADEDDQRYRQRLVESLIRLGSFDEASRRLEGIDDRHRDTVTVMLQRAEIEQGRGNERRARELIDRAVAQHPTNPIVYTKRASMLLGRPELVQDALSDLGSALRIDPNDWRTLRLRAGLYYSLGREDEALRDLRAAVRHNPGLDDAVMALLGELIRLGRDGEAFDVAEEVLSARPNDLRLMASVAQAFSERQLWNRSAPILRRAWERSRDFSIGMLYIDSLIRQRPARTSDAMAVMQQIADLGADVDRDPDLLIGRAMIEAARGRREDAERFLRLAFDGSVSEPSRLLMWSRNIARVYEQLDVSGGTSELMRTMARERRDRPVHREWLELLLAQRLVGADSTRQDGLQTLERLTNGATDEIVRALSFRLLGTVRYQQGEHQSACDVWLAGLELYPHDWEMANNLGYTIAHEFDDPERGLRFAELAVEHGPQQAEAYDTLSGVLRLLNRLDEAQAALERAAQFAGTPRTRVNILLSQARLALAQDDPGRARERVRAAQTALESQPTLRSDFESDIAELVEEIAAAE